MKNFTDIIIIGAGLSGIGAACHLERKNPEKSYQIFESRKEIGGTWSLFKYPGIRSDSDMYTFGTFGRWSLIWWRDLRVCPCSESSREGPASS